MQLCSVNLTGLETERGGTPPLLLLTSTSALYVKFPGPGNLCNALGPVRLAQSLVCCGFISNDLLGHIGLRNNSLMSETPR